MDVDYNPREYILDVKTRYDNFQTVARICCIIFASFGGYGHFFGLNAITHSLLLVGLTIDVGIFETILSQYDLERRL